MPCRDRSFADRKYITGGWKSLVLRDFCDPGHHATRLQKSFFPVRGNLSKHWFSEGCGHVFAFWQVVATILLSEKCKGTLTEKEPCQKWAGGDELENRVEKLRNDRGLNQEEFALAIRVSRHTVSSIETGKYNPSLDLAFTIADFSLRVCLMACSGVLPEEL